MNNQIRNFVIIAHVDHGKSTLADRLLERTGTIEQRLMKPQYLDQLELERERGITIKMAPVRMAYRSNSEYILNLIDTPGHSDFSYEVSRALAAVEGAILLVDATQGIQAQTLANFEAARRAGLTVIGAVNKIDAASKEEVLRLCEELGQLLGEPGDCVCRVSGKTGEGIDELLRAIVARVPAPSAKSSAPPGAARGLVFDSLYDDHKGVIAFVRVFGGGYATGDELELLATRTRFRAKEIGYFVPQLVSSRGLHDGEIGYVATGIKDPDCITIGDTLAATPPSGTEAARAALALPGYERPQSVVFVSFYPEDASRYDELRQALGRLRLTDAALAFEGDVSEVLGRGFKGGFLGRLHFEITAERLAREFRVPTVHSFPSVEYRVRMKAPSSGTGAQGGEDWVTITNPKDFPNDYREAMEPMTRIEIVTPPAFLGKVLELKELFRFSHIATSLLGEKVIVAATVPLADVVRDLDDKLKSVSQGFASLHYAIQGWDRAAVEKMTVLVAGNEVPGLTRIVPASDLEREARATALKLKTLLPEQQFAQAIQVTARGRVIARETIPALRKDVTGYLYGGDRTRKMKLWKKQQAGKKKLKEMALQSSVKIPAAVFKELLKR